ncbi:MAG: DUF3386 family protein [Nitrospirae bacterium]|nr:MAG: DUF3386 family protein [Nitrospirota bacterium]
MEMYTRTQQQVDVHDSPEARALLQQAFEKTARWPADFHGFEAEIEVNINGTETRGSVLVKGPQAVTVHLPDPEVQKWVETQLAMIAVHRSPRSFDEADGKYILTLDPDDHHPLGRKLLIHGDGMDSCYRILHDRITQINRKMPHVAFTINVEDSLLTPEEKYLTTRYTVYYFSPQQGTLQNVESFSDTHKRVDGADLPAVRRVITYEHGSVTVKLMTLRHHRLL